MWHVEWPCEKHHHHHHRKEHHRVLRCAYHTHIRARRPCSAPVLGARCPAPVARRLPARGCCVALQARRWAIYDWCLHSYGPCFDGHIRAI